MLDVTRPPQDNTLTLASCENTSNAMPATTNQHVEHQTKDKGDQLQDMHRLHIARFQPLRKTLKVTHGEVHRKLR